MAFALLIIGAILLVSAARGTTDGPDGLFTLLRGDFTGQGNFIYWFVAILLIGMLGYIPKVKPISVAFLALVVLVLFLSRGDPSKAGGGFFEKFTQGLAKTTTQNDVSTSTAQAAAASITDVPVFQKIIVPAIQNLPPISNLVH